MKRTDKGRYVLAVPEQQKIESPQAVHKEMLR